jgi:hypothetical protein
MAPLQKNGMGRDGIPWKGWQMVGRVDKENTLDIWSMIDKLPVIMHRLCLYQTSALYYALSQPWK